MNPKAFNINKFAAYTITPTSAGQPCLIELDLSIGLIFWGLKQVAGEYLRAASLLSFNPAAPRPCFYEINYAYAYINGLLDALGINPTEQWLLNWVADQPRFNQKPADKLKMFALLTILAQKCAPPLATTPGASQHSIAQIKHVLKEARTPATKIALMLRKIGIVIRHITPTARVIDATSPGMGTAINDTLFTQTPLTNISQLFGEESLLEEISRALNKRATEVDFNQKELIVLTEIFGVDTAKALLKVVNLQVDSTSDQIDQATSLHVLQPADNLAYDFTRGLIEALETEFGGKARIFPATSVIDLAKSVQNFLVLPDNGYTQRLASGQAVLSNWSEALQNDETGDILLAHRFKVTLGAFKIPRHRAVIGIG
jgi:hypothetical protein